MRVLFLSTVSQIGLLCPAFFKDGAAFVNFVKATFLEFHHIFYIHGF